MANQFTLSDPVGTVAIAITATDDDGNPVTDTFDLTVEAPKPPDPPINEINGDDRNNRLDGTAVDDALVTSPLPQLNVKPKSW